MRNLITRLYVRATEQNGQAMAEYAIILGLVTVVSIVMLTLLGTDVLGVFTTITSDLAAVPGV